MNTEKTIRCQAKKSLESNWVIIIASIMSVFAVVLFFECLVYSFSFMFDLIDPETGKLYNGGEFLYNIMFSISIVAMISLSPAINGIYKMFYKIACGQRAEISDLLYCFKAPTFYLRTVLLNIVTLIVFSVFYFGLDIYSYACMYFDTNLYDGKGFDLTKLLLLVIWVLSAIIKICGYLIFINFPLFAYAEDDTLSLTEYTFGMYGFAVKNFGKSLKLFFGFSGWFALCFFVVPAFYVLPYIMTSFATSAKWLFALERDRRFVC